LRFVVVFDTNVLFSAVGWRGSPFRCLELAREGRVEGVVSAGLLAELTARLRAKLSLPEEQVFETLADLLGFLRIVRVAEIPRAAIGDPDDDAVIACALAASATHIITGDKRHLLPLGSYQGIAIVSPSAFLEAFAEAQTD
jgi:putative PIN family toxin of toxin-antitoxin system